MKQEFLQKLKEELEGGMNAAAVQEQLAYYSRYIDEEVAGGRTEAEVVSELGDPWVIAKSILDMSENEEFAKENSSRESGRTSRMERQDGGAGYRQVQFFGTGSKWTLLLVILGLVGVIMLLAAVVSGLIALFARFLVPILVVVFVIRLLKRKR